MILQVHFEYEHVLQDVQYQSQYRHTILIQDMRCQFTNIMKTYSLNLIIGNDLLIKLLSKQSRKLLVASWQQKICDHLVDASIRKIKYLNGHHNRCIGPQISPCIRSKNVRDSLPIFIGDGRISSSIRNK